MLLLLQHWLAQLQADISCDQQVVADQDQDTLLPQIELLFKDSF